MNYLDLDLENQYHDNALVQVFHNYIPNILYMKR